MDSKKMTGREALFRGKALLAPVIGDPQTALNESLLMLGKAWKKDKLELVTTLDEALAEDVYAEFMKYVQRRLEREPLQYILETQSFMDILVHVDENVLIPRAETEILVQEALQICDSIPSPRILDMCTGSGAIAVSLATCLPEALITAADISASALDIARRNARKNRVEDRITFVCGDFFAPLPENESYNLIVCNPPYISETEYRDLAPEVQREPYQALYGGKDGLDLYRRFVLEAPQYLNAGGRVLLEIGWRQGQEVSRILSEHGFTAIKVFSDWNGLDRLVRGEFYRLL